MNAGAVIVFAGPSLANGVGPEENATFDFCGPAAQGDVLRAALLGPRAIVVIDGYFEHVPSVYHKEILWALHQGIPVYGAASTGAMRAAELHTFGMVGVGAMFDAYASGKLERDDAVALVHAPAEMGYRALSEPMVNIEWTLKAATAQGVVPAGIATGLLDIATAWFYPERSFDAVLAACRQIDRDVADRLAEWLPSGRVDIKRKDAEACLKRVADDLASDTLPQPPPFAFHHTDAFESLMHEVISNPANDPAALDRLRTASPEYHDDLRTQAIAAELALALDRTTARSVSPAELARAVTEFRNGNGLLDQSALQRWLSERGLDIETLSKHLEEQARISRAVGSVEAGVADRMVRLLKTEG